MATEVLRLASSALSLRRFTKGELSAFCKVKPATANSWLQRNGDLFDKRPVEDPLTRPKGKQGGRPPNLYMLRPEAVALLKEQIAGAQPLADATRRKPLLPNLDEIDRQFGAWYAARDARDPSIERESSGLRTQIRLAWEDFAELERSGDTAPSEDLKRLADIEVRAGIATPPDTDDLRQISYWLAGRLKGMSGRKVPLGFSRRTLWLRAEAGGTRIRSKVIAAALGAPVWADEGLADERVAATDLELCAQVADEAPTDVRLRGVAQAIDLRGFGFCRDASEAQAVTRGLTARPESWQCDEVLDWLGALSIKRYWSTHLAPVAFHVLAGSGHAKYPNLLDSLRDDLKEAVDGAPENAGSLRHVVLEYAQRALGFPAFAKTLSPAERVLQVQSAWTHVPGRSPPELV